MGCIHKYIYICLFISARACMPACLLLSRLALSLLNMDSIMHQIHSYYKSNTEYKRKPKSALVHEICKVLALMQDARTSAEVVPNFPPIEEHHGQVPRYHALLFVAPLGQRVAIDSERASQPDQLKVSLQSALTRAIEFQLTWHNCAYTCHILCKNNI